MSRIDVTQDVVLERIVTRLRDQLTLSERQCYETLDAFSPPEVPKSGQYFVAVSCAESSFPTGEQADGNFTEDWAVTVTGYSRVALDQTDHAQYVLRDAGRGLLIIKRKILTALVGHDLTTSDDDTFLRQTLFVIRAHRPVIAERTGPEKLFLSMQSIDFGVSFDWDLGL